MCGSKLTLNAKTHIIGSNQIKGKMEAIRYGHSNYPVGNGAFVWFVYLRWVGNTMVTSDMNTVRHFPVRSLRWRLFCSPDGKDWWRHVHYFALFGAIGWSFGGSMSYMMVVGYSHSSQSLTVFYGFANLFAIGFLWAALGGAGTALPAFLTHTQLSLFLLPIAAVFIGWSLQAVIIDRVLAPKRMQRHESPLYWYDTDWVAALVAIIAALIVVLFRGGLDMGTSLVLYMGVGWFAGFLLLVNVCRLRMTPPRGDNWAGCVGMIVAVLGYCWRYDLGVLLSLP